MIFFFVCVWQKSKRKKEKGSLHLIWIFQFDCICTSIGAMLICCMKLGLLIIKKMHYVYKSIFNGGVFFLLGFYLLVSSRDCLKNDIKILRGFSCQTWFSLRARFRAAEKGNSKSGNRARAARGKSRRAGLWDFWVVSLSEPCRTVSLNARFKLGLVRKAQLCGCVGRQRAVLERHKRGRLADNEENKGWFSFFLNAAK